MAQNCGKVSSNVSLHHALRQIDGIFLTGYTGKMWTTRSRCSIILVHTGQCVELGMSILVQPDLDMLRAAAQSLGELDEMCYEGRRQSITDFINLAIDYDHDTDRKRIAERLTDMGHSMQLLSILESALLLVKEDQRHGELYYKILSGRYFNAYCRTNEDAFLTLGMPSSTYYRHSKKAVRMYAAYLWCIIIPDLVLKEQMRNHKTSAAAEA